MRESIGGSWILSFVVFFIVIFAAFLVMAINYTNAFKTKNGILDIIEQNEGYSINTTKKIEDYIANTGYSPNGVRCDDPTDEMEKNGYCVEQISSGLGNKYKVTTYISINVPFMNFKFLIPVSGETNTLYYTNDDGF